LTPHSIRRSTVKASSSSLLAKYAPSRRDSSAEVSYEEGAPVSKSILKAYKSLLKTAIGNILIEMLVVYMKKGVQPYTLNISHLDLDKSPVIEEQDESVSPSRHDQEFLNTQENPSLTSVESEVKEKEIKEIIKESYSSGGIDGNKVLSKILIYISNKLAGPKFEKKFIVFLGNYVKEFEKNIKNHDFNIGLCPSPFEDDDLSDYQDEPFVTINGQIQKSKKPRARLNRMGSGESMFSMNSDLSNGEKAAVLTERILMSPAVMKVVSFKHNPSRMMQKANDSKTEFSGKTDKSNKVEIQRKRLRKMTFEVDDKILRKKDEQVRELLPFGRAFEGLPVFLSVRIENLKRRWIGKPQPAIESPSGKVSHNYLECFTILAVDDSNFALDALKSITTPYKKQFEFAKDGFEAFNKFQHLSKQGQLYHLILIDLMMPNCDGIQATQLIRKYEQEHSCPSTFICGLSALENPETKKKCLDSGMNDFCCKPLDANKLKTFIESRCKELNVDIKSLLN